MCNPWTRKNWEISSARMNHRPSGGRHQLLHGAGPQKFINAGIYASGGDRTYRYRHTAVCFCGKHHRPGENAGLRGGARGTRTEERYLCQSLPLGVLHERDLDCAWLLALATATAAWGLGGHGGGSVEGCSGIHRGSGGKGMLVQVIAQGQKVSKHSRRLGTSSRMQ